MSTRSKQIAIAVVFAANFLLAGFCGFAYAALTAKMYLSTSWQGDPSSYTPMAHTGWRGGFARYLYSAFIALLLQGVLWIFNFSALGYFIEEYKSLVNMCLRVAVVGYAVTVGIACVLIALSLH